MKTSTLSFLALLALFVTVFADDVEFVNNGDDEADMTCPENEYMYYIYSEHNNKKEDRRWAFKCRFEKIRNCEWTDYVNDLDGLLAYACPGHKVVTGINSYHDNKAEDRRFKFQCCDIAGLVTNHCYYTDYVNDWDKPLTVNVNATSAIKGASSYHSNAAEDRRWKFYVCELEIINTSTNIYLPYYYPY